MLLQLSTSFVKLLKMHTVLGPRGYTVLKSELDDEEVLHVKKELTVTPFVPEDYQIGKQPSFKVYLESSSKLYLPKFYGLTKYGRPTHTKINEGENINVEFRGNLRPEQEEPVSVFRECALDPLKMGGILNMQCAAGKTVMAIYIICMMKKKALVIVHKDFLLNQWKERIQEFAPSARIGTIKAKTIDVEDKDIVIGSLQSLSMKEYDENVFNGFGMLVVDEAHHTGAEVFSKALQKINVKYTLGLSATVERKDGLSKVFKWYLGNVIYKKKNKGKDIIDVHMLEYTNQCKNYCGEFTIFGNKPNMSKMINNICDFEPRVEFIVQKMQQVLENEPQRRILVLSDRRSHLQMFKEMLEKYNMCDVGFYYGGMKQDDLKESEGRSIILGTYAMISEGFDVKGLDTLVLASPKSDVVQSVGRILRTPKHERKSVPLVIDIVDDFSMFPKQAKKRVTYYKSCKYNIIDNNKPKVNSNKIINIDDFAFKD